MDMMPTFEIDPKSRRVRCDPRNPDFYNNPYPFYGAIHAQCPVFFWEDYGHWCFAGWEEVNAYLRDKRFGRQILHVATREELGWPPPKPHLKAYDSFEDVSILSLEPPEHTRMRTLVNRAFVSRQVDRLRPRISALANQLIDDFEPDGHAELIEAFAAPIPVMIISEMLGVPAHMAPQLLDWSHKMVAIYEFGATEAVERETERATVEFSDYVRKLADEKRKNPDEGLISYMIATEHRGQKLTDAELVSTTILLLNAGHEATVHQAGNGIKSVLESGRGPAALFETPDMAEKTVEEALRFDAPLHMFTRFALADMELPQGISVKKGDVIGLNLGAANHDPNRFATPHVFDPYRTDQANISFGAGIHFCIGAPLARIELQEALGTLFKRLPVIRLAQTPRYSNKYHFHGLEKLEVEW